MSFGWSFAAKELSEAAAQVCGASVVSGMAKPTGKKAVWSRSWKSCSRCGRLTVQATSSSFVTRVT